MNQSGHYHDPMTNTKDIELMSLLVKGCEKFFISNKKVSQTNLDKRQFPGIRQVAWNRKV